MCTEFWDAYSGDGQKLGYTIKRTASENIPDGVYHIVVRVYVFREDGFLLTTMRDERKQSNPLMWEITGGSVLAGERPVEAALRELYEETGISKTESEIQEVYSLADHPRKRLYHVYMVKVDRDTVIKLQDGETCDYRFIDFSQYEDFMHRQPFVKSEIRRYKLKKNAIEAAYKSLGFELK